MNYPTYIESTLSRDHEVHVTLWQLDHYRYEISGQWGQDTCKIKIDAPFEEALKKFRALTKDL